MKITNKQIRRIIREELIREEKDADFDITQIAGINLPAFMKKMLDPDATPAQYAKFDQQVDTGDKPDHQAIALVSFALSYTDEDEARAKKILSRAIQMLPKIMKAKEAAAKEPKKEE